MLGALCKGRAGDGGGAGAGFVLVCVCVAVSSHSLSFLAYCLLRIPPDFSGTQVGSAYNLPPVIYILPDMMP